MEHADFDALVKIQLKFWQGILRLSDWDITIDYWPHAALDGDVARVNYSVNQMTATIALRIPEDLGPVERDWPEEEAADYDFTLLHELLHLKCVNMKCEVEWAEEQLANHVAKALVKLYRESHAVAESTDKGPVIGPHAGHYL